jgi:deazaflavin-dependent oxidoreductase (nitroreductase family)
LVSDVNEWNRGIIEEFRANQGKVGGMFEGRSMVLLTTKGAKSGAARVNPLVYLPEGDRMVIFASKGGAPTNPDWFHNIKADPNVTVEVGTDKFAAKATIVEGAERDRLYAIQAARIPQFAEYQAKTDRLIPVVALQRAS